MRTLTNREQRTVQIGGIVVAFCLILFLYRTAWPPLQIWRAQYQKLVKDAVTLKQQASLYTEKAAAAKKLMENYHLDPAKLSRTNVVADASAAIQQAALGERLQIGPIRESPARGAAKQLATIELELSGPVQGMLSLLHRLDTLGYPLVIESIQFDSPSGGGQSGMPPGMSMGMPPGMPSGMPPGMPPGMPSSVRMSSMGGGGMPGMSGPPGMLKLKLTLGILDFEQWKQPEGKRNA